VALPRGTLIPPIPPPSTDDPRIRRRLRATTWAISNHLRTRHVLQAAPQGRQGAPSPPLPELGRVGWCAVSPDRREAPSEARRRGAHSDAVGEPAAGMGRPPSDGDGQRAEHRLRFQSASRPRPCPVLRPRSAASPTSPSRTLAPSLLSQLAPLTPGNSSSRRTPRSSRPTPTSRSSCARRRASRRARLCALVSRAEP
jgi:hypothetical protein